MSRGVAIEEDTLGVTKSINTHSTFGGGRMDFKPLKYVLLTLLYEIGL